MDILGTVMSPVMGLFGLPGEAFAVLISAFFAKASGCATAASMYEAGALTLGQASMMLPACILMGTLIGHYARIVLVTDTNYTHFDLYIISVEAPGNIPGAFILPERRKQMFENQKFLTRGVMADQSYVAHGLDYGGRRERLLAGIHADENADQSAHRP